MTKRLKNLVNFDLRRYRVVHWVRRDVVIGGVSKSPLNALEVMNEVRRCSLNR